LEDITIRALRVLRRVDLIACEDTRKARILLARYHVRTPLLSCHQHNEAARAEEILENLHQGKNVALLSEAGTPGISDPGEKVIRRAIDAGIPVVALPGPTAFVTALVVSGLPLRRFTFEGFPPRQPAARRRYLEALATEERTMIFYEAPHRLKETLGDMYRAWGSREAAVARELTKVHEEVIRGRLHQILEHFERHEPRGEVVIVVAGCRGEPEDIQWERLLAEVKEYHEKGYPPSRAVQKVARRHGVHKSELYRRWLDGETVNPKGPSRQS
jgi:16S rRNA (cytidine1402-2'-O)-methyltransferase